MDFLKNKHIVNSIRVTLNDLEDKTYPIEEKIDIINNAIKMYSKYIYNFKKIVLSTIDGVTYTLPEKTNFVESVRMVSNDIDEFEKEGYTYYVDEFNNIVFYENTELEDIEVVYDCEYEEIKIEEIEDLEIGENEITLSDTNSYIVGDVVMVKDETNEEISKIISKTETSITVSVKVGYTDAYLIGNSSVKDFEIMSIYGNYYNASKKSSGSGQIKSESWTQGGRSRNVSYASYNGKGETGNESLDLFINKLKADKNYKFKEFQGLSVFTNYK